LACKIFANFPFELKKVAANPALAEILKGEIIFRYQTLRTKF
jgi:hypothetical protein